MQKETWKDIEGYEGLYQVSDLGRIKSLNFNKTKRRKLLKQACTYDYKHITLFLNGKRTIYRVHRLVAVAFIENIGNKPEVNHIDGKKSNNKASNLEWCTSSENSMHAIKNKLSSTFGEGANFSKLKKSQVIRILEKHKSGERICDLAKYYKVSETSIINITKRRKWKHVKF